MIEPNHSPAPLSVGIGQLYKEIRQIYEQYKREVPKKRRPWPTSIQSRVLELWKLGVSTHQISQATTLPCQTMYSWRQRLLKANPGFVPVRIAQKRRRNSSEIAPESHRGTMTVVSHVGSEMIEYPTVRVILPNGLRIEGIPVDQVARIAREFSGS